VLAVLPVVPLAALVAWVPILAADATGPDEGNLALVGDERALHFWDVNRQLPPLFARLLELPDPIPAWDVYLVYPPGVRWDADSPAAPAYWQHQLSRLQTGHRLDPETLAPVVRDFATS
jgi:hypothetical protein